MCNKYNSIKLFLEIYNYDACFENEESADTTRKSDKKELVDLSDISPLEVNEEVKDGKALKLFSSKQQLKNEIRRILYLLYQYNKITKNVYNNLIKSL